MSGDLTWGGLQFLAGALVAANGGIQALFSTFSNIADQSLFLTDLVEFFKLQPTIRSKPDAIPAPRPMRYASSSTTSRSRTRGKAGWCSID